MTTRRDILGGGVALGALALLRPAWAESFAVVKTEAEWRQILTPDQYLVLREEATERPYTSPLLDEHRAGTFHCVGCGQAAFSSDKKYDSGTGWPSFWDAIPGGVGTQVDRSLGVVRTEVHCSRCGGHLGHVFNDGPAPTHQRYCMNGLVLQFEAA
jgi:peptide-methionine (R)-S-oxide reductase